MKRILLLGGTGDALQIACELGPQHEAYAGHFGLRRPGEGGEQFGGTAER